MEKQITKVVALEKAVSVIGAVNHDSVHDELIEKLEQMLAQEVKVAENKKGKKGVSKTAKEKNENAEKALAWFLEESDPEVFYSGAEVAQAVDGFEDFTPQKMTPILKLLAERDDLEKGQATSDKKKVGYKVK